MAQKFDPYHKWLGIPPKDQPPHFYRLLGVELFESDPEVIEAAANRQLTYIQDCATGEKVAASQKLLNEITQARLTLLAEEKRKAYDNNLKKRLAAASHTDSAARVIPAKPLAVARPLDDALAPSTPVITPASPKPAKASPKTATAGETAAAFDFSQKRNPAATKTVAATGHKKATINWRFPVFLLVVAGLIVGGIVVAQALPGWLQQSTGLGHGKVVAKRDDLRSGEVADSESGEDDLLGQPSDMDATVQDDEETPTLEKGNESDAVANAPGAPPASGQSLFRGQPQGPDPLAGPLQPDDLPGEVFQKGEDDAQPDPGDNQPRLDMIAVDVDADVLDAPAAGGDDAGQGDAGTPAPAEDASEEAAVQRQPLPDDEALRLVLPQVKREHRAPTSRQDKLVMAQTMIDHAEVANSAMQYALLEAASHTAVAGRDLELAMEAVQKLVERFETSGYRLRVDLLREFGRPSSASAPGADLLKREVLLLLDEVTQQDRQDVVPEILEIVAALAERWRDADLQEALDRHRDELPQD